MGKHHNSSLVFFGDDISHVYPTLRALQRRKCSSALVSSFLEKSYVVFREELHNEYRLDTSDVPRFTSIFDLVEGLQRDTSNEQRLLGPLTCVAQLAGFISYFEERPDGYLDTKNTCVLGHGFGQLSAAAIASCESLVSLASIAVEVVRIALRTGLHVHSISKRLGTDCGDGPWSVTVFNATEIEVQHELSEFYKSHETPNMNKVYISRQDTNAVTISGLPFNLRKVVTESAYFAERKTVPLGLQGLYHNPMLYEMDVIHDILQPSLLRMHHDGQSSLDILSNATGERIATLNKHLLFERVVNEMLTSPFRWDKVLDSVVVNFERSTHQIFNLLSFGTTQASSSLISIIHERQGVEVQLEDLLAWNLNENATGAVPKTALADKIAIVGMAIRAPGADDCEEMWRILEQGLDMHKKIPQDRFDITTHVDPSGKRKNTSHTPYGAFIEKPGLFDARFFGMSPAEAAQTDPMHRLALITAYEALEMSGFVPNRTPSTRLSRIGTFYGQTSDDWREINAAQNIGTYLIPGGVRAFAPGRINYWFKFSGPSYSIDTACSSSLAAIQVACTSLLQNECDTAVSGGLNILTNPDIFAGLSRGGFLSKTGSCKVFDETADGYCRADSVGTLILKRLEDAEADNDNILGVILGTATNHSADAISITHPHAESQANLYQNVLNTAGVDALDVSVVEMHGTGTQAGDVNEMHSVTQVFAPESRRREIPLHLGAVKANLGHSEAAAGITGLIKLLLMLQKNSIPPHVGIKTTMNSKLPQDLSTRNVHIPRKAVEWKSEGMRLAFLNNFSAAGGNTALLLQEAPPKVKSEKADPRSSHVITVSAKSMASLKRNTERLISYAKGKLDDKQLANLAYTTCARRMHHNYRLAVAVSDIHEVEQKLSLAIAGDLAPVPRKPPRVVMVFTGQGSFYLTVGKKLFETSSIFRDALLHMNKISEQQASITYLPLITGNSGTMECDLENPAVTHLAQLCVQMALVILWRSWGVLPDAVLGHSLGEYAALYAAGVLSMSDAIYLVAQRAKLIQTHCTAGTHGLLVVQSTMASIEAASCGIPYEVACRNSEDAIVLAQPKSAIEKLKTALTNAGIRSIQLDCPYGFHSSQCDPILDSYQEIARGVNIQSPKIPVISSVLGKTVTEPGIIDAAYISQHTRETVNFVDALRSAEEEHLIDAKTAFIELGPHPTCCRMIQATIAGSSPLYSLHKSEDVWMSMSKSLAALYNAGLKINWSEVHRDFETSQRLLEIPRYSFDEKNYWIDYAGDWCLTKGEIQALPTPTADSHPTRYIPLWERKSNLSTSAVHCIVEEHVDAASAYVKFQTDLSEPLLNSAITGHSVNGVALCPSSIYADIALTIGDYLHKQLNLGNPDVSMDVCHMEVSKPLIANKDCTTPQILQVSTITNLNSQRVELSFASLDSDGRETAEHAKCVLEYRERLSWLSEWSAVQFLVQERIDDLKRAAANGMISNITKGLAYKLFASFVQYQPKYRGMDVVILDSTKLEATASVTFQTNEGNYFCSPYWIDSLAHLSGFILNSGDAAESGNFVFISHGWKSMRFSQQFTYGETYQTYVRMLPGPKNIYEGNVYIFDNSTSNIVGVVGGLKFQRIPVTLLNRVLPPAIASPAAMTTSQRLVAPKETMQRSTPVSKIKSITKDIASSSLATRLNPVSETKPLPHSTPLATQVLNVISENLGVDLVELRNETFFGDIGLDSLMSLTILSQLREIFGFEVPGTLFMDQPSVKDLRVYLSQFDTESPQSDVGSYRSSSPASIYSSQSYSTMTSVDSCDDEIGIEKAHSKTTSSLISTVRNTIAEQMDILLAEITDSTDLPSLGMDSLMSLSILGTLREETGLDWPSDLFIRNPTIEDVARYLEKEYKTPKNDGQELSTVPLAKEKIPTIDPAMYPRAKSFLLQGSRARAKQTLFLFPDGSGSASSYARIPPIGPDLAVYGFNCPFMTTPELFTIGIAGVATLYLAELRRLQPTGPYLLGGWSAGGVIAYEVMQQLLLSGERVERLILLDAPNPLDIVRLPPRLHHFFGDIGLLGDLAGSPTPAAQKNRIPEWLLPHFEACINALVAYKPQPIVDRTRLPKVHAIWARYGVCGFPEDPKPDFPIDNPPHLKWLLANRTDFGTNGWDRLIPGEIRTEVLDGNHFTIMNDILIKEMGMAIQRGTEW